MDARDRVNPDRRRVGERPGWVTPAIIGALLLAGALPGPHRHDSRAGDHQPQRACCPAGGAATCQPERHHATSRAGGAAAAINRNKWRQPDHSRPRSAGLRCLDRQSRDRDADGCSSASLAVGSARSAAAFAWSSAKQLLLAFFVTSGDFSGFAQAPTAGGGRCRRCARRQRRFTRLLDCRGNLGRGHQRPSDLVEELIGILFFS